MSAPPGDSFGQQFEPYGQPSINPHDPASREYDAAPLQAEPEAGRKKKREYAAQAFGYGTGANVAPLDSQMMGAPDQYAMAQPAQAFGAHPQQVQQQQQQQPYQPQTGNPQPPYGQPYGMPNPQQQQQQQQNAPVGAGAYPPSDAGYHSGPAQPAPGVGAIATSFSAMGLGGDPRQAAAPHLQARPAPLNQLYPSDLLNQPFDANEIDRPPPPIILPPNTSATPSPHANCAPRYVRSTLNAVPTTHSLLKKSKLPLALVIQPYGALHDSEEQVPVVQDLNICRCRRCRTYINPWVAFLDNGHRWRCNMCNLTNDVPTAFDWDAASQKTLDRWARPELNYAVMDFVAQQEYMVRPPQPLIYLFLLDVGYASVANGLLATSARTILDSLDRIPNADRRTRLGFIAVDSSLHYFAIPKDARGDGNGSGNGDGNEDGDVDDGDDNAEATMLVVSDIDEPFLPVPQDLLSPLTDSRRNIEVFLNRLPDMFLNNQSNGSAMGPALRAGYKLIAAMGGKMVVLSSSLPNLGVGKLEMREDKKLLGTSKEVSLLQTASSFYKSFAVECSKNQVSIDMFLFSSQYQDVASLSNLPRYTGGQTWYYPSWNAGRPEDAIKFASEFSDYLSSEIGLEAVLRVRATTGLRMNTFYGNFFNRSSDLCAFPAFPRDQCYVVEVAIDENLTKNVVCLQTAVLHTTCNGERRIRVMTLALPTTGSLADVYASADQCAVATYYSHKAVERALGSGPDSARESLQSKLTELLQTFRKELAGGNIGGGGLQFPANLRALPFLFLGLIKHLGLRRSTQIPSDLRSAALCLLSTLPVPLLMQYIYPKLYSLHDMPEHVGVPDQETGQIVLPPVLNLSSDRLVPYGLYLLDDGQAQFLYVGRAAVPQLIQDAFGVEDRNQVRVGKGSVAELENDLNERVRAVIQKSRDYKSRGVGCITLPHLYIVREDGEPSLKLWLQTLLVEDRADQGYSGAQWLGVLREKVSE